MPHGQEHRQHSHEESNQEEASATAYRPGPDLSVSSSADADREETTGTASAVIVRETTPDQVPPLPDAEEARRYVDSKGQYARGQIHFDAGHYQKLVLDVRSQEFYFYCDDWRVPRGRNKNDRFPPSAGVWAPFHWQRVADILFWTIDSHYNFVERPYLTLEEGNAFAHEVAALAQALLLNLQSVPGTNTYDWSAESASAGMDIQAACSRHWHPPQGRRPGLVNMAEAVSVHPSLVQDRWASLDDRQLDEEAERLNRYGLYLNPAIAEALGIDPHAHGASLIGTRAWLYKHRREAAAGRPVQNAAAFLAAQPALVTADTTSAELEAVPERASAAAEAEGIVLLGNTTYVAHARREELRKEVLDELAAYGRARAAAEATAKSCRSAVYARLYRVLSWEDRPGVKSAVSDTDLGELAHVSSQTLVRLRERLDEGTDEEGVDG
ncbi:hypothetical protein [Streptomyces hyaluromycini]|uniref:hypothetical protein n=1 Tax=Streptomyces hyaluromycini TaxID=1377993 RepID=UPI000B5C2AEF|nr:hypothetical protein [Streptomyces hyaluromycini]